MRWLFWLCAGLSTHAAAQSRPVPVGNSDIPLQFELFSVKPPSGANWFFLERGKEGVLFGKPPTEPGHTILAWAAAKQRPEKVDDQSAYMAAIRTELERRLPPGRHEISQAEVVPFDRYPEACVRYWFKATDKGVKGREGIPLNFLIAGIYCLEPKGRQHNIDVSFSERGGPDKWNDAVRSEAESFFASFQFLQ